MSLVDALAALPFVLRHIDDDAMEIRGEERVASKRGKRAIESQEDILGEIIDMFAGSGESDEHTEDHLLVFCHDAFELGRVVQDG